MYIYLYIYMYIYYIIYIYIYMYIYMCVCVCVCVCVRVYMCEWCVCILFLVCFVVFVVIKVCFNIWRMVSFKYFWLWCTVSSRFSGGLGVDHTVFHKNSESMFSNCVVNGFYCVLIDVGKEKCSKLWRMLKFKCF